MKLTSREEEINEGIALGYTPDEIGDFFSISRETVRKMVCNIKAKIKRQKSTELTAEYWCHKYGTTLETERQRFLEKIRDHKEILSIITLILFFTGFQQTDDKLRFRARNRDYEIESVEIHSTL